jgi:hypothetical protein
MTMRRVVQDHLVQGVDEQIAYTITTTPWGSSPGSIAVKAYDQTDGMADVTATVLSGSAAAVGDVITTPKMQSLTLGHVYRIEVKFTCGGNTFECWFEVEEQ